MKARTEIIRIYKSEPFELESGAALSSISIAYQTHGRLNKSGSNAILICHALTGDAHVAGESVYSEEALEEAPLLKALKPGQKGWWDGIVGPGKALDSNKYFVICCNLLGSCYGTSGPASINPETGTRYQTSFPKVTIRDMVNAQYALINYLGVQELVTVTGGSLGGMLVLEWALMYPERVKSIIPIATSAQHSAWCIGFNHLARQAIFNDPEYNHGKYTEQPRKGLSLARQIGMVSYRSDINYNQRFARQRLSKTDNLFVPDNMFQVESYLNYQGSKLVRRFDANSFICLSYAMDYHDVTRDRGRLPDVLGQIEASALCIGIDSDILYPAHEQRFIAGHIVNSHYAEIKSALGHDAFLVEFEQLDAIIRPFLAEQQVVYSSDAECA